MTRLQKLMLAIMAAGTFTACKKAIDPVFIIPPSNGAQIQLNGLAGSEAGSAAGNSVYLDLSADKTTAVSRSGWDLGFYCGSDFRVILNNAASAGVKVLSKNDLAAVGAADTIGLTLAVNQLNPLPSDLVYFDEISGDLSLTAIPSVSATDASNNVIILNRGAGGGIVARPWIKMKILRNSVGGYTLQYAGITETTFKTLNIPKDPAYHFKFASIDNGIVDVQPEKQSWDLVWSYSVYETNFGAGQVPYNFSDLIAVNNLSGVTVKEKIYADAATATTAYAAFNKDSVAATTMVSGRWTIGSNWRSTQPATGARTDRFYVIKDPNGNYYKFKCLAMGVGADGGTRGKPEFKYALIN
ncbi:MAG: HmuY family protein [Ferruginibacter sp.]